MIENKQEIIDKIVKSKEFRKYLEQNKNYNAEKELYVIIFKEFINWNCSFNNKTAASSTININAECVEEWMKELSSYVMEYINIVLENEANVLSKAERTEKVNNLKTIFALINKFLHMLLKNLNFFKTIYNFELILKGGMIYKEIEEDIINAEENRSFDEEVDKVAEESSKSCFCWKYLRNTANSIFKSKSNKTKTEEDKYSDFEDIPLN